MDDNIYKSDKPIKIPPRTRNNFKNRDIFEINEPKKKKPPKSYKRKVSKKYVGK